MRSYWGSVLSLVIGVVVSVVPSIFTDLAWWYYVVVGVCTVVAAALSWPKKREELAPTPVPEPQSAYMRGTQKGNKHTGSVDTDASVVYDGDSENTEFGAKIKQRRPKP